MLQMIQDNIKADPARGSEMFIPETYLGGLETEYRLGVPLPRLAENLEPIYDLVATGSRMGYPQAVPLMIYYRWSQSHKPGAIGLDTMLLTHGIPSSYYFRLAGVLINAGYTWDRAVFPKTYRPGKGNREVLTRLAGMVGEAELVAVAESLLRRYPHDFGQKQLVKAATAFAVAMRIYLPSYDFPLHRVAIAAGISGSTIYKNVRDFQSRHRRLFRPSTSNSPKTTILTHFPTEA